MRKYQQVPTLTLTNVIPLVILHRMKTAISIDTEIYNEAEQTARQLGLSRSKLYSMAILEFVKTHKPDAITATLNEIYRNNSSKLDEEINQLNDNLFTKEEW